MSIVGARPNMMKVAPLLAELRQHPEIEPILVHTGQHYDYSMSQVFFDQLRVPPPDYNLDVGSGTHYAQTAEIIRKFGDLVQQDRPDMVLVAGDVNSTYRLCAGSRKGKDSRCARRSGIAQLRPEHAGRD